MWPKWSHMDKQRGPMASIGVIWGSTGFHSRGHSIHLNLKIITKLLSKVPIEGHIICKAKIQNLFVSFFFGLGLFNLPQ
jgi:hypothetical protein